MLIHGTRRWRWSSYRIGTFSGMFMMWSSAWLSGCCCRARQLLREDRLSVLIFMKCFCDASSRPSVQSLEPGLVPAKPPTFQLSSLHFYCSQTNKGLKEWKKMNSKPKLFQKMDSKSVKSPKTKSLNNSCQNKYFYLLSVWATLDRSKDSIPWPASDLTMATAVMEWTPMCWFALFDDAFARKGR